MTTKASTGHEARMALMDVARPFVRDRDYRALHALEAAGLNPTCVLEAAIFESASDVIESCLGRGVRPSAYATHMAIRVGGDIERLVMPVSDPVPLHVESAAGARNITLLKWLLSQARVAVPSSAFVALGHLFHPQPDDTAATLNLLLEHASADSLSTRALCAVVHLTNSQPEPLRRALSLRPWAREQLEKAFAEALRLGDAALIDVFVAHPAPLTERVIWRASRTAQYLAAPPARIAHLIVSARGRVGHACALRALTFKPLGKRIVDQLLHDLPLTSAAPHMMELVDSLAELMSTLLPRERSVLSQLLHTRVEEIISASFAKMDKARGATPSGWSPRQRSMLKRMAQVCIQQAYHKSEPPETRVPLPLYNTEAICP
jgi:hypothetical protein